MKCRNCGKVEISETRYDRDGIDECQRCMADGDDDRKPCGCPWGMVCAECDDSPTVEDDYDGPWEATIDACAGADIPQNDPQPPEFDEDQHE